MLIASSPTSGATSSAINTLVSRIALDTALPRIREGLVDQVAISLPVRIRSPTEQHGDVIPMLPTPRCCGNQSSGEATRDRDVNLLASFNAPNQLGCVLAKFAKSYSRHTASVAQVLLSCRGIGTLEVRRAITPRRTPTITDRCADRRWPRCRWEVRICAGVLRCLPATIGDSIWRLSERRERERLAYPGRPYAFRCRGVVVTSSG